MARSNWKEGHLYFAFLLECERVATKEVPKLLEEINQLKKQIDGKVSRKGQYALVPNMVEGMFGEKVPCGWRHVPKNEATELEAAQGRLHHNTKIQVGIAKRCKSDQSIVDKALCFARQAKNNILFMENPSTNENQKTQTSLESHPH